MAVDYTIRPMEPGDYDEVRALWQRTENHAGVEFWRRRGFELKEDVGWMQRLLTS